MVGGRGNFHVHEECRCSAAIAEISSTATPRELLHDPQ